MAGMNASAFDKAYKEIEKDGKYFGSCFCSEQLCTKPFDPCCFGQSKCYCVEASFSTGDDCFGEKGCLFGLQKVCCCVEALSTKDLALGCCGMFCCGKKPMDPKAMAKGGDLAWMEKVFWCNYCICVGLGVGPFSPCFFIDQKHCCIDAKGTSGEKCMDEGGCVMTRQKCLCTANTVRCPPTLSMGCGICFVKCIAEKPASARTPDASEAPKQLTMEEPLIN